MSNYKLSVDLGPIFSANQGIASAVFPLIGQAVRAVAEEGAYRWKGAVWKARLWEVEKSRYAESIRWNMTGPYSAEISTDYALAGEIENGRPAKDMKRVLQTSQKARMVTSGAHAGQKYLIIPFRHNTPTASGEGAHASQMPPDIYAHAKNLAPSRLLPPGTNAPAVRMSATGHLVPQHSYSWGGRLPAGLAPKLRVEHKTDPFAGMVRMDTSTKKNGRTIRSSAYLTFRIMGEWSSGWVVGAKPGLNIVGRVAGELQPILDDAVGHAVTLQSLRR